MNYREVATRSEKSSDDLERKRKLGVCNQKQVQYFVETEKAIAHWPPLDTGVVRQTGTQESTYVVRHSEIDLRIYECPLAPCTSLHRRYRSGAPIINNHRFRGCPKAFSFLLGSFFFARGRIRPPRLSAPLERWY